MRFFVAADVTEKCWDWDGWEELGELVTNFAGTLRCWVAADVEDVDEAWNRRNIWKAPRQATSEGRRGDCMGVVVGEDVVVAVVVVAGVENEATTGTGTDW